MVMRNSWLFEAPLTHNAAGLERHARRPGVERAWLFETPLPQLEIQGAPPEEEVFGTDDRVRVTDSFGVPARWVCAIDIYAKDPSRGGEILAATRATGILIGPRHVLTAAHVFQPTSIQVDGKSVRVPVSRVRVSPARNGDNTKHPLGWAWSKSVHRPQPWTAGTDYALIVLDRDLSTTAHKALKGALGYWGQSPARAALRALEPAMLKNLKVTVIGYPGDRCGNDVISGDEGRKHRQIAYCRQRRRDEWASTPWRSSGDLFVDPNSPMLQHTADTYEGESGAPVCVRRGDTLELIGVHGGVVPPADRSPATRNRGARVTPGLLRDLVDWINRAAGQTVADLRDDGLVFVSASAREDAGELDYDEAL